MYREGRGQEPSGAIGNLPELADVSGGEATNFNAALRSIRGMLHREEAVAGLYSQLQRSPTPEAIALLAGFSQNVQLYDENGDLAARPQWRQQYGETRTDSRSLDFTILLNAATADEAGNLVRAHIGDLVYSYRTNQAEVGAAAVNAYLQLAIDPALDGIKQYVLAGKAFRVAKRLGDTTMQDAARARLLAIADEALVETTLENPAGGTILQSLEYFIFCDGAPLEAEARLRRALEVFADDWDLKRELALFLARLQTSKEESDQIISENLRALIKHAGTLGGFLKEARLREILSTARAHGLRDVAGEVSSALAHLQPEDYDFQVRDIPIEPDAEAEAEVARFLEQLTTLPPLDAWMTWALQIPGFPPLEERPPYELSVIDRIATLSEVNRAGHVSFQARSEDDIVRYRHHQQDRFHYEYEFQLVIGPGLRILLGRPDGVTALHSRIADSPLLTPAGGERVSRAFNAVVDGSYDPAGDALPTIESSIRTLAIGAGISIYNADGAANVFKTLGGLIRDLTPTLGEMAKIGRFWDFALTDQLGYNIRNDYLHGFVDRLSGFEAVIVLQVLAQIILLFRSTPVAADEDRQPTDRPRDTETD